MSKSTSKKLEKVPSDNETLRVEHGEKGEKTGVQHGKRDLSAENARLANPLADLSREELLAAADEFVREYELEDIREDIVRCCTS
jgi:hypothetical protein